MPVGLDVEAKNVNTDVEVANVSGDDVARYKLPFIERNVHAADVSEPSDSANCGAVDDAIWSVNLGDVVPNPTVPRAESKALSATAPSAAPFLYWNSVPVPAGVAPPPVTQVPFSAKQPDVMLIPTFDVVVAEPEMLRPDTVVVPKPVADTRSAVVDAEFATSNKFVSFTPPNTVKRAYGVDVPMPVYPPFEILKTVVEVERSVDDEMRNALVDEAIPNVHANASAPTWIGTSPIAVLDGSPNDATPVFEIEKSVVVAVAVDDATAKSMLPTSVSVAYAWTDNFAHGDDVPTPRRLLVLSNAIRSWNERFDADVQNAKRSVAPEPVTDPPPVEIHEPLKAKQPAVMFKPLLNVDVAEPVTLKIAIEVEPVDESSVKIDDDVVANVDGDDVEIYNLLLIARKLNGAFVAEPSANVSCGRVDDATVSVHCGVVVPRPNAPIADEYALAVTPPNEPPLLY
jgi:hypothetical protein